LAEIPSGTVTLLFTDIEGSTGLVQQLGEGCADLLNDQRQLLRAAVGEADGYEVDCRADELFAVFQRAKDGVAAALAAQRSVGTHTWPEGAQVRVRIGLHTGEPAVEGDFYVGLDVSRAARICSAAHGGQILLSETTRDLVLDAAELKDLGAHSLPGLPRPERIFQLLAPGLPSSFPPLHAEGVEPGLLKKIVPRARQRAPTLEEEAWRARELLRQVEPPLQKPLAELGAALFTADRAVAQTDNLLRRIDRKRLAHRVAVQRDATVISQRAREAVESLERQAASVDRLLDSRRALAELSAELPGKLDQPLAEDGIDSLRRRVAEATAQLDEALAQATRVLDPLSFKLQRTRHRGVYRSGSKYVVPFVDTVGIDRQREFATLAEACDFREVIQRAEQAKARTPIG
jgi:class 3 adenylate cyclase